MTLISIRERGAAYDGPVVSIDGEEYPFIFTDPFSQKDEDRLEWYFEKHLRFPFVEQVRASEAAASIVRYGETLFNQLFSDRLAYSAYSAARAQGIETLRFEVAGSPAFQRLHWEALRDPDLNQPLALQAPFVRRNIRPRPIQAQPRPSTTLNLLVVTARPDGGRDVGYRTISQPLVRMLRKTRLPVNIEILRPGTYEALLQHLETIRNRYGSGYYHIIHFDVHGSLLTFKQFDVINKELATDRYTYQPNRYARGKIAPYEGVKAFLCLERDKDGIPDLVEATELAQFLQLHQVPIAILNACQSGRQIGDSETSLGSQLMQAGTQMVLAMGYSVTVSAAEILMERLYIQLFDNQDLTASIRSARLELHNRKARRGYYNQTIELEDWLLPVVYQNQPQSLRVQPMNDEEHKAFFERRVSSYPEPKVVYEFVGRDLDVLYIERKLLRNNLLLVRAMGGAGKTTLLHHLGWWWQTTGFIDRVFYFGYDKRAWNRQQIMVDLAAQLLSENEYLNRFQPLGLDAQQAMLTEHLRSTRHLLILDNMESITGTALAIQHTLPEAERASLRGFLADLRQGKTLVLLGSRSDEKWLAPKTFGDNIYELPGLDPEAASELADLILTRASATKFRGDPDLDRLNKLLGGFPLALEVVLSNLSRETPTQVLQALQGGDSKLDMGNNDPTQQRDKTNSILQCIDYSFGNLDEYAQALLLCLAPFTGAIDQDWLEAYTNELKEEPTFVNLSFERWKEVLEQAANWGLLTPHPVHDYLHIQPTLPYFLRARLREQPELRDQIELAFYRLYDQIGRLFTSWLTGRDANERKRSHGLIGIEFENISHALEIALHHQRSFFGPYEALYRFLGAQNAYAHAVKLSERVLSARSNFSADGTEKDVATEFYLGRVCKVSSGA